ncbi:hypothetical protein LWI28_002836 [Acer negundo]|uniref:Uncharacterized protein n=1 Tax=Acer negundo TaxID=4023 RepID=A0AAD5NWV1_ACENE|nr:hypothetical protein LWI28_002836 [Acer negundo]
MFQVEELNCMQVLKRGQDYIEVRCGCTSQKYGDYIGKLKVTTTGRFVIDCECFDGCPEKEMTPYDFEKHSQRFGPRKWKDHIWVILNDEKVPLSKTCLIKYFKHGSNEVSTSCRGKRNFHRDEFITCSSCEKERRFRLRTKEDCMIYHAAAADKKWKCSDRPYEKITCVDDEERDSRKRYKGCPESFSKCEGCNSCVCVGCLKCRSKECDCSLCVDFMQNAEP